MAAVAPPKAIKSMPTTPAAAALGARFGHAVCGVSAAGVARLQGTNMGKGGDTVAEGRCSGFLVFGGVSAERDFGDVWLVA